MTESIYWYDFETTGIDSLRDRPLQFAGVRTDLELNEIAPPDNFFCKPGNDVIPSPEALLVTGIMMSEVVSIGRSEIDFSNGVLAEFSKPQTCVAGFNNLRFDDEFTRQMLYRNFHDPYAREWRNGNSRWDIIDLIRAAYALRPDGIKWCLSDEGIPSFRLQDLTRVNGIEHAGAHDALADVYATIAMARLIKEKQPRLYQYMFSMRAKQEVIKQLYPLGKKAIVHVSSMYPARRGCTAIVLPICQHPSNNNGIVCFDLSDSPEALLSCNPKELARLVFSRSIDLKPGEQRIGLKTLHINRCPVIAPLSTLDDNQTERLGIDKAKCLRHMDELQHAQGLVETIQEAIASQHFDDHEDPDLQLYQGGFFSDSDRQVMSELQSVEPHTLNNFTGRFQDERLDEMLFRYRARNFHSDLSAADLDRWNQYRLKNWNNGAQLKQTQQDLRHRLDGEEIGSRARMVLEDLSAYLTEIGANFAKPS